jgi:hypothetical protein
VSAKKSRLWIAAGALLATAACSFVGTVRYYEWVDEDGYQFKEVAVIPAGKILSKECKSNGTCRLSLYRASAKADGEEHGERLSRTSLANGTSYVAFDAGETSDNGWNSEREFVFARKTSSGMDFELWGIGNHDAVSYWQAIDWNFASEEPNKWAQVNDIALGRNGRVYVAGALKSSSGNVPVLARYDLSIIDGVYEVTNPSYQKKRSDNNQAFRNVTHVDCDQTNGRVYAVDVVPEGDGFRSSVLEFQENLGRGEPPHPDARSTTSEITALQATDGLVGYTSALRDSDPNNSSVWLDVYKSDGDVWTKVDDAKDGDVRGQGALLTFERADDTGCGYAWTIAKHDYRTSDGGTYKVFGRHTFCMVGDND